MEEQGFFFQAFVYLTAAVISVPIAKRLGLGSVLGYLLAGIIIGPFVLGLIGEEGEDLMHFAEFGVVMMLFLIGLELRPSLLWKMKRSIFGLGGLQLLLSTVLIGGIALVLGQQFNTALAIGLMLALSSTAIILQTLAEKGLMKTAAGQASFSVLLFQDIAVIPILVILPLLGSSHIATNELASAAHGEAAHGEAARMIAGIEISGWVQVALILIVITGIIIVGRFLALHIFRIIAKTGLREIFTATALLLVIAIALAMEYVGLSPALGAFLAGVVLADNEYRHELEANVEPFKGLLLGLFFLAVGASIDFNLFLQQPGLILVLLAILVLVKFLVLAFLGRLFGLKSGQGIMFSFALAQGGEFAFVLISYSLQNNVLSQEIAGIILMVVALSMAITPLLLLLNEKIVQPLVEKSSNVKEADVIEDGGHPVVIAGFDRFGITIGRLLIANGIKATILDDNPDNIEVLRKFGVKVYYGDASRPDLLHAAGCADAKVLVIAMSDKEKSLQIVDHVQREYPHIKIVARSVNKSHAYDYIKRGIKDYNHDMLDSSLESAKKVLTYLGFNEYQAHRAGRMFKHQDFLMEQELYKHHQVDEKKYILEARRLSADLEEMLKGVNEESIHASDNAWDNSTLREEVQRIYAEMENDQKNKEDDL